MADTTEAFEAATAYRISEEDIDKARLLVGLDEPTKWQDWLTAASEDAIRNFAESYGDDNPLFADPDYARSTRWAGQIAPPQILSSMNKKLLGDPIDPDLKKAAKGAFRGIHVFVSGGSWEFYRPVRPGDTVYSFGGTESVEEKQSEFAGRSVIQTRRIVKINQHAEILGVGRIIAIYTERKTAASKGKYSSIEPANYSDEDMAALDEVYATESVRGAEPRYWEDVEVGEPLPKMAKGPITTTDVIVFHAGGYGFVPYRLATSRLAYQNRQRIAPFYVKNEMGIPDVAQRVHWDPAWAQAIGNPMAYDYGVLRECWIQHYLTDWVGDDGWLFRQSDEIRKFNYLGDAHIFTGEVVDKRRDGDHYVVDIALRGTNQRGVETCPGTAAVLVPSREGGPVILPEPPVELKRKAVEMLHRHHQLEGERRTGS